MNKQAVTDTLKQFIRFGLVGGSGVVVNLVVAYLMTQLNGGVSNDNRVVFELPGPYALRYTVLVWIVAFMIANLELPAEPQLDLPPRQRPDAEIGGPSSGRSSPSAAWPPCWGADQDRPDKPDVPGLPARPAVQRP